MTAAVAEITATDTWINASTLSRPQLMKAAAARGLQQVGTNVELVNRINQWQQEQGLYPPPPPDEDELDLEVGDDEDDDEPGPAPEAVGTERAPDPDEDEDPEPAPLPMPAAPTMKLPAAGKVASSPAAGVKKRRTGEFPSGWRAEYRVGWSGINDELHFRLIEETHHRAVEAGYRTKGAPYAGLRIGYHGQGDARTVVYEVAISRED
ncbi:MAG TPA: hypothetical protein VF516_00170 [Kofleriaceae bacterium]